MRGRSRKSRAATRPHAVPDLSISFARDFSGRIAAPNFNQRGYEGAAPSDLMEATGLEQGGIYRRTSQSKPARRRSTTPGIALDTRFERTEEVSKVVDRLNVLVQNFQDRRAWLVPGGRLLGGQGEPVFP